MKLNQELPVLLSRKGLFHLLVGGSEDSNHTFGGPGFLPPGRRETLRRVFTLDLSDPRLGFPNGDGFFLPLFYCFESAGEIEYTVGDDGTLRILRMSKDAPEPDWPYPDYPINFPVSPLRLEEVEFDSIEEVIQSYAYFAERHCNVGDFDPAKYCYVIATPREEYGVSLWGEDGDAEGVTVGFSIDRQNHIVKGTHAFS